MKNKFFCGKTSKLIDKDKCNKEPGEKCPNPEGCEVAIEVEDIIIKKEN